MTRDLGELGRVLGKLRQGVKMKIIANELAESVLCTLPNGDQVEVIMLCAEGEDCSAEPSIEGAVVILKAYLECQPS